LYIQELNHYSQENVPHFNQHMELPAGSPMGELANQRRTFKNSQHLNSCVWFGPDRVIEIHISRTNNSIQINDKPRGHRQHNGELFGNYSLWAQYSN